MIDGRREAGHLGTDADVRVTAEASEGRMGAGELVESGLNSMRRLGGIEEAIDLPGG